MKKHGEELIKNMLGESFIEDLAKFEMINLKTDTAISHEEIADAFNVVPRVVMAWLISKLSPMAAGDAEEFEIPFGETYGAKMAITKIANDVYHGEVFKDGHRLSKFQYRSIPGVGLVLLTSLELYDVDNLISHRDLKSKPVEKVETQEESSFQPKTDLYEMVGRMIDEKLALRDLISKVVDKKIEHQEAVREMFLMRMASEIKKDVAAKENLVKTEEKKNKKEVLKLKKFLDKKKPKLHATALAKSECISCPDCGSEIFSEEKGFAGCVCFGENRSSGVTLKKTEKGVKVSFSKDWDPENIEMLLKILQKRGGHHE